MKNEFKEFFELTKSFQLQKIQNDFLHSKMYSRNKLITICVSSLTCFLGIYYSLYFQKNYDKVFQNFRFRMNIRDIVFFSNFKKSPVKNTNDKLDNSIKRFSKLLELVDFDFFKLDEKSIFYFLKTLKKELTRINHYLKFSGIDLIKQKEEFDEIEKFHQILSIFAKCFEKVNIILEYDISYLPNSIDILDLFFTILKNLNELDFERHKDLRSSIEKFNSFFERNSDVFEVIYYTDIEKFYKIKKIFILISKMKFCEEMNQGNQNISCNKIKKIIETQEAGVDKLLRFV